MQRIIRLTESDLGRIVRRVINEQKLITKSDMIGKTFKFNGKMCKVEKAFEIPNDGGFLVLPEKTPNGCRKNNGVVGNEKGYIYLGDTSITTMFTWDTTTNNWKDLGNGELAEPSYSQGRYEFVTTESYRRRNY